MRLPVVYIAGAYRGDTAWQVEQNIRKAEEAALRVAYLGAVPLCPHSMTRYFNGTLTDEYWLNATMELLKRCDAILMLPGWMKSSGSRAEYNYAIERIATFEEENTLKTWLKDWKGSDKILTNIFN